MPRKEREDGSATKERMRRYYLENRDRILESRRNGGPEQKEAARVRARQWYAENRDRAIERSAKYNRSRPEARSKINKKWREANRPLLAYYAGTRRASLAQRTPRWLTDSQAAEIKSSFELASDLSWLSNGGLHVDHIVPLQGKDVCGLHVPWNLQLLPASLNLRKGNRHE